MLFLAPALCLAGAGYGNGSATTQVRIMVVVPPVFRVLEVTRLPDGYDCRVWTNMQSVAIGGRVYGFDRVGETTLKLPVSPDGAWIVYGL